MKTKLLVRIAALSISIMLATVSAFPQSRSSVLAVCLEEKSGKVSAKIKCARKEIKISANNLSLNGRLANNNFSGQEIAANTVGAFGNSGTNITSFGTSSTGITTSLTGNSSLQNNSIDLGISTSDFNNQSFINLSSCYQTSTNSSQNSTNSTRISVAIVCRSQNDLLINDQYVSSSISGVRPALAGKLLILNANNLPYGVDYEFNNLSGNSGAFGIQLGAVCCSISTSR